MEFHSIGTHYAASSAAFPFVLAISPSGRSPIEATAPGRVSAEVRVDAGHIPDTVKDPVLGGMVDAGLDLTLAFARRGDRRRFLRRHLPEGYAIVAKLDAREAERCTTGAAGHA
jgi:hypothetical protein